MPDHLLTLAETAALMGQSPVAVLDDAANELLTWTTTADGDVLYHRRVAEALLARRNPPAFYDDPLVSRQKAALILGVSPATVAHRVPRHPDPQGRKSYLMSAVLAVKAERDLPYQVAPGQDGAS